MPIKTELERGLWGLALLALLLLLCLWGNGDIPFLSVNEARRAVTVREMYEAGNWLTPHMNGDLYLAKPPLFYWLALLPVHLSAGVSEWAMRLPSALFALAVIAGVYVAGTRLGGRSVGIFASLFLGANAGFSLFARRAEIEMTLTAFCFLSLLAAWFYLFHDGRRRWAILSYALLGCSLLTKGPVSLLLVTVPILAFALIQPHARTKALLCDGLGWLIALSIGASWYVAVTLQEGVGIWESIFQQDIVSKVSGNNGEVWYAYLGYLAGDFFPFWLLLLVRPRQLWRSTGANSQLKLMSCVVLVPLIIFSLFSDKHAKYLLPIYPAVALLLAFHWVELLGAWQGWKRRAMVWLPPFMLFCFVAFFMFLEPRVFAYRVQALPEISHATSANPKPPLYSLGEPDMRLVYYAGRTVKALTADAIRSDAGKDGQLFVDGPIPPSLLPLEKCVTQHFEPFLKHRKEAWLIGLGETCHNELPRIH
ncbi:ArnT family glycosyltransferase [Pseudomonas sp. TCU-HL1]|uniref:ArnT family glycosyltransferase n=1 Tax=Pseudomonas sp. TCU-HL1 TaxID=1856685 RepID=UPI00083CBD4D|nr:glycosyltransferase family 39 protein [Pseudomonas sp. TCU-HL1]AOE87176.1 glycosyltransferase family protein [Pseudomonas sp. TCU-HL1]